MCGIAGYLGSKALSENNVQACLRAMRRRGPDHSAMFKVETSARDHLVLLHARLSIIDLDPRSNQPFTRGSKTLVYNGEVYNYRELRDALKQEGSSFATDSDTEVLLELVREQGLRNALDQLEGMWAFALWDSQNETLVLCRDRFGEKPLYFFQDQDGIYFGSEVKFIHALLGRRLEVNKNHVNRYLINGYKALYKTSERFFQGLQEVPGGSLLEVKAGKPSAPTRYWRPQFEQNDAMSLEQAIAGTRERLIHSVDLRLRADVPLAFCMSGGIDSNSLLSIAKRVLNFDVHGFTIMNTDARYEESELVQHSVEALGIKHHGIVPRSYSFDFISKLRELVLQHDAPVYTVNYFTHWLLMGEIRAHGYKVSISGTSADELFSGYYDHHLAYLHSIQGDPALLAESIANWKEKIRPIVRNPYLQDPGVFLKNPSFRGHIFLDAEEFSSYLHKPWHEGFTELHFTDDLLRNRMANELFVEATPVILHEDDLNAMYFSVENRSPFLDRELFDFASSIPSRHLIRNGVAKYVLRESMRGIVPDKILDNPRKVGFNAPIFDLLDMKNAQVRDYLLNDSPIFEVVRREKIQEVLQLPDLTNSFSKFVFNFLNAKIFLEEFA